MIKGPIHPKETGTVNMYAPNAGAAKYVELILCSKIIVWGSSISHFGIKSNRNSQWKKSFRKKLTRKQGT